MHILKPVRIYRDKTIFCSLCNFAFDHSFPTDDWSNPLTIRLDCLGWHLGEVISRCRDDVLSLHMLHHARHQGQARPGMPVQFQTITAAFREARGLAGIIVDEGKTPPTFHELRSLGIRRYQAQGYDPQALAGHKDAFTTAIYTDGRGAEWIDVAA